MKIKGLFFLLLVLVLSMSSCKKDKNIVKGTVTYVNLLGVEKVASGATIYLMVNDTDYESTTTTDADGKYEFNPVADGKYHVEGEITFSPVTYVGASEEFFAEKKDVIEADLVLR